MKKKIYQDIICLLFNDDELTSDIIEQIKLFTNNIDFVQFKDIENSIDMINNKTIVFVDTEYRFNFLTSNDIDNIAGIKNKNIFSIFVVNTGNDINEMICRNKIIDKQPNNEIWYKTNDGYPVTLCLDDCDGEDYIISNEYDGDHGVIKYKCDYIEKIEDGIFSGNYNLTDVYLPKTVKIIGNGAFEKCFFLEYINFHRNIENIGYWAFYDTNLKSELSFPRNLKFLGDGAFRTISKQMEILIYNDLKDINDGIGISYSGSSYTVIYLEDGVSEDLIEKIKISFPSYAIIFFDKDYSIVKIIKNDAWMK